MARHGLILGEHKATTCMDLLEALLAPYRSFWDRFGGKNPVPGTWSHWEASGRKKSLWKASEADSEDVGKTFVFFLYLFMAQIPGIWVYNVIWMNLDQFPAQTGPWGPIWGPFCFFTILANFWCCNSAIVVLQQHYWAAATAPLCRQNRGGYDVGHRDVT